jgi:hypothetical protein
VKYQQPGNARARPRATSRTHATPATVRSPRAHAEAPADPAVHAPRRKATVGDDRERLDGARWPVSTRRRANRRTPLAAAPPHIATPCCPRRACTGDVVDPTTSYPTFSAHINSPRSLPSRTRVSTRAAAVRHCRRPVSTVPQSFSPRTHESQSFPVNHNTSPSHVLIKRSHPFNGVRASATAVGPPPSSSLLRRFSKPRGLPGTFPGSHGSLLCSTWLSPGQFLTAVELPAGAPPLLRRRRSPESSLADPPPPIGSW